MADTNDTAKGVGLVLDGGGGKGAYQVGVLKALMEQNLLEDVTAIAGSSIGAVNAILFAMEDMELFEKAWDDIDMLTLFDLDAKMLAEGRLHFSREEMLALMDKYVDYDKLKNSKYKIYATIAKVLGGDNYEAEYRLVNEAKPEDVKQILLASTSLPVIYESVNIGETTYRDGGLADNSPVQPLYDAGIRQFILIGMASGKTFDTSKWPDASFITLYPSRDIGDLIDGTLDFGKRSKEFRRMLGYKDALRAVKTKFAPDDMYIRLEPTLAENDFQDIKRQLHVNQTYENLSGSISSNLDKFNEIAKKYENF